MSEQHIGSIKSSIKDSLIFYMIDSVISTIGALAKDIDNNTVQKFLIGLCIFMTLVSFRWFIKSLIINSSKEIENSRKEIENKLHLFEDPFFEFALNLEKKQIDVYISFTLYNFSSQIIKLECDKNSQILIKLDKENQLYGGPNIIYKIASVITPYLPFELKTSRITIPYKDQESQILQIDYKIKINYGLNEKRHFTYKEASLKRLLAVVEINGKNKVVFLPVKEEQPALPTS